MTVTGGRNSCGFDGKDRLYGRQTENPPCQTLLGYRIREIVSENALFNLKTCSW